MTQFNHPTEKLSETPISRRSMLAGSMAALFTGRYSSLLAQEKTEPDGFVDTTEEVATVAGTSEKKAMEPIDLDAFESGKEIPMDAPRFLHVVNPETGKKERVDIQYSDDGRTMHINWEGFKEKFPQGVDLQMYSRPRILFRNEFPVRVVRTHKIEGRSVIVGKTNVGVGHRFLEDTSMRELLEQIAEEGEAFLYEYDVHPGGYKEGTEKNIGELPVIADGCIVMKGANVQELKTLKEMKELLDGE